MSPGDGPELDPSAETSLQPTLLEVPTTAIIKNPNNPRRYFNDDRLDLLRTSILEVGILVPLIAYQDPTNPSQYILMDGERRWNCAWELALESVPVSLIRAPNPLENLLRMFNIHAVRDDWPLISVALSLQEIIAISGEDRETRLAEMTGLGRGTVRRAKRLLSLPGNELDLIQSEAHLDRSQQVHREDLYLEIDAAESVIRNAYPDISNENRRAEVIRSFASKRENNHLTNVTEFRDVGKIIKAAENDLLPVEKVKESLERLIQDAEATPNAIFKEIAEESFRQEEAGRKADLLAESLNDVNPTEVSESLRLSLTRLREAIDSLLDT